MTPIKVFYRGDDCTIFYAHSRAFSRGIVAKLKLSLIHISEP
ncbi:hypothetical protein MX747_22565, partial [Klebsiella pneumoniae]|nr:hypothetical protein [Klebsiella pneumoniae]